MTRRITNLLLIAITLVGLLAGTAYATRCSTKTIFKGDVVITCIVCCDDRGNCTQSCF